MKSDDPKVVAFQKKYQKLWTKQKQILAKIASGEDALGVGQTQCDDDDLIFDKDEKLKQTDNKALEKKPSNEKCVEEKPQNVSPMENSALIREESQNQELDRKDDLGVSEYLDFL